MSDIPPTLPFHLAKAYGVQAPRAAQPLRIKPVSAEPTQAAAPTRATDRADLTRLPTAAQRLVAAKVDIPAFEGVFSPQKSQASGDALPFYRHPADRNAAATAVNLGRSLDVSG